MIHSHYSSGGSASNLEISRKQTETASWKACGGKPLVDGRGSLPGSMLGTVGLELTNFINSDLTWKVSKGNRSSSRRARKSVSRNLEVGRELFNKDLKTVDMPVSESEKLGVSVLGCRFSEKAEHVPIKKRRFLFRSPSPPPRTTSPCPQVSLSKSQPAAIDCAAFTNELGQIVDTEYDVDGKNLGRVNGQLDDNEDFSGISILAAAACSNNFGRDNCHAEDGSGAEESFACDSILEVSVNNESCSLSKGVSKEDVSSAEISTDGTGSCISAVPAEELAACLRTDNSSANVLPHGNNMEEISMQDHSVVVSNNLFTKKDQGAVRAQEFASRDDRLFWDLNTAMDSWERPTDYLGADYQTSVAGGISDVVDDGNHGNKMGISEGYELQREPGGSKCTAEKVLPCDSRGMAHEKRQANIEEHKLDVCTDTDQAYCSQEKLPSSEINCAAKLDPVKATESLHSLEIICPSTGSGDFVPADNTAGPSASIKEDISALDQSVNFGSTGSSESLSSHSVASLDTCADNMLPLKPNCFTGMCASVGDCNAASTVTLSDGCAAGTSVSISSGSQVEKQEDALPAALSGNATCETGGVPNCETWDVLNEDAVDVKEISGLHDERNAQKNMVGLDIDQPLKSRPLDGVTENPICEFNEVNMCQSSAIVIEMPLSGALVGDQPALAVDANVQHVKVSVHDTAGSGSLVHNDGEEHTTKSLEKPTALLCAPPVLSSHDASRSSSDSHVKSSDKMALEEHSDNGFDSDVSHDNHATVKVSELEVDYDSQYEDGEVRESIIHTWEEYDGEDIDAEHVDYGSDNANNLGSETEQTMKNVLETNFQPCLSGFLRKNVFEAGSGKERALKGKDARNEVEASDIDNNKLGAGPDKVIGDGGIGARGDDLKKASQSARSKMKMSGWDRLPDHRNSSDTVTGVRDGSSRMNIDGNCMDGLDAEDAETRMDGSKELRRELRSRIEGRAMHDVFFRKDRQCMQGIRGRYTQHAQARGHGGDRWADSPDGHRGLKRHRSPNHRGPTSYRHPGPENGATGRLIMDASSHGVHRRLTRSGSPVDRDETFGSRVGIRQARELSPGRRVTLGRGRSIRYGPRVDGRGPRGRYHGPVPDDCTESSLNHSHPSSKREKSFSPIERRGDPRVLQSGSKSPSRSRTRSPNSGNPSFRRRSKSPTFRSDVRMQRLRSPHRRPGFLADHMVGFRSMPRSQGSPPHNSRWIGDRKDGVHFREQGYNQRSSVFDRRSPGRFSPQDDRFDLDAPRAYRSMHLGRFSEMDGVGRGGMRYDGSDDDRGKHGYRYGLVHPARRYDMNGAVKQFRYNVEDGFVEPRNTRYRDAAGFHGRGSPKDCSSRGIDNRIGDLPRRFREERGPFIYRRDGKYNANSKSIGMHESDEEIASRRKP